MCVRVGRPEWLFFFLPYVAKKNFGQRRCDPFEPCHVELSLPRDLLLVRIIMVKIFADSCYSALYGHQVTLYFSLYILQMSPLSLKQRQKRQGWGRLKKVPR